MDQCEVCLEMNKESERVGLTAEEVLADLASLKPDDLYRYRLMTKKKCQYLRVITKKEYEAE
jgi:hypothetical protein